MKSTIPRNLLIALISTLLVDASVARAQTYSIASFTIDGGGGTSSGGSFTLSGTIGQAAPGTLKGGSYALIGGFWDDVLVLPITGGPTLAIRRSGNTVIIAWPSSATGFVLEATDSLWIRPIEWTPVGLPTSAGDEQTIPVELSKGDRFFRLRKQ